MLNLSSQNKACVKLYFNYNIIMDFEWDKRKATNNIRKHGVSFE